MLTREQLDQRLERFSAARRRIVNGTLGYRLGGHGLLALLAALLLLAGWVPNAFANLAVFLALVLYLLVAAGRYCLGRERFASHLREAFAMEALGEQLRSRLVSAWDFLGGQPSPLQSAVIARAADDLAYDFEARLERGERDRRRRRFAAIAALALVVGLSPWCGFAKAVGTLRIAWRDAIETLFPVQYELLPGTGTNLYTLDDTAVIGIRFITRSYDEVQLVLTSATDQAETETRVLQTGADNTATTELSVDGEVVYHAYFVFGSRRSEEMTLIFTTRPELIGMQSEIVFPGYTRLLPRALEGIQPRLVGLVGSRLTLGLTFSKQLRSAELTWDDGSALPLDVVGRYAATSLMLQQTRSASLQIVDEHGLSLAEAITFELQAQPDERPVVRLPRQLKEDLPLLAEAAANFGFGVSVSDDYGVARCILQWQKVSVENPLTIRERGEVERLISPPRRKALVNFDKVFEALPLVPGDKIVFAVEVFDNRTPDAQHARSSQRSFFIYQEDLGGLNIHQLGFGDGTISSARLAKARRTATVKQPDGQRTREQVINTFAAAVNSDTVAPRIQGAHQRATADYFRVLSQATEQRDAN